MGKKKGKNGSKRVRDPTLAKGKEQSAQQSLHLTYPSMRTRALVELATCEPIYAAVTRISNALATMPCHLYIDTEIAADDPREELLSLRPNSLMSAYTFKRAMEAYRNTEGRCYAAKLYDKSGRLRALSVLDPSRVTPMIEEESRELWYVVQRYDGVYEYIHSWYVLSMQHISLDGINAPKVTDVLSETIQYSANINAFSLESAKGVSKGLILEYPGNLNGDRRKKSVEEFLGLYRQSGGQVIALESGVKASKLDGSPIDSQVFDVERITRSRVATVYNLPPHLLGDYSDTTGSTIEQQNIEFLTLTMQPIVQMWEEELNFKLLTPEERQEKYAFRFDVDAYLRSDGAALASRHQAEIRSGVSTVNELRRKNHRKPVPGGDKAMISKDLAPVEFVAAGATIDADQLAGEQNS